ncbi:alpha-crystallin B chain isoform X1 [Zootermopsis nevadensis]|uniref:Protein lethal(2)essential for life n=1 Tax=Zootermopsis nevadensis TaxID=136037 RepID=A0A067RQB8_ZOONE|nr:alpha-crystallin B chain isoform X1 [Zootermopsis nevadensis]KDR22815.1 Protein lethal(2)essential for life [Zootermopsis nevadensis]
MAESGIRRNIPIKLGDFSVIDTEFSNIRERFDAEMRKMEEEMARFRSELMTRESNFFTKSTTSRHSQTKETKSSWKGDGGIPPKDGFTAFSSTSSTATTDGGAQKGEVKTWLDGFNSPLIQNEGDSKLLKLRFDVSQYQPEEIVVKTVDNKLLVHAKHEEKTESKSVYREYNREFMLPKGTNPESIKSSLSKDGVLTVEAPLPAIEGEKLIPITQQ